MREFEMYEIVNNDKCLVCGCRNKVHTERKDRTGKFIGYSLTCCGCGNIRIFDLNYENNGNISKSQVIVYNGKQRCIRKSYCPRKDCKFYNSGDFDENSDGKGNNEKNVLNNPIDYNYDKIEEGLVMYDIVPKPPFI